MLYGIVRDHFETFRAEAARAYERDGLPRFIEEEFRGFLRCGFLAVRFCLPLRRPQQDRTLRAENGVVPAGDANFVLTLLRSGRTVPIPLKS